MITITSRGSAFRILLASVQQCLQRSRFHRSLEWLQPGAELNPELGRNSKLAAAKARAEETRQSTAFMVVQH